MAAIVGARTPSGWASRALTMCRWPTRFVGAYGLWFLEATTCEPLRISGIELRSVARL